MKLKTCATVYRIYKTVFLLFILAHCREPAGVNRDMTAEKPAYEELRKNLKSDNSVKKALSLTDMVEYYGDSHREEIRSIIMTLVQVPQPDNMKQTLALSAAEMQLNEAVPYLVRFMQKSTRAENYIFALGRLKAEQATELIVPYLFKGTLQTRITAAEALVSIDDTSVNPMIIEKAAQTDFCKDSDTARVVARVLGLTGDAKTGRFLHNKLKSYRNNKSRTCAASGKAAVITALGQTDYKAAALTILPYLERAGTPVGDNAVSALVMLENRTVLRRLPVYFRKRREIALAAGDVYAGVGSREKDAGKIPALLQKQSTAAAAAYVAGRWQLKESAGRIETLLQNQQMTDRDILAVALGRIGLESSLPVLRTTLAEKNGEGRHGAAKAVGLMRDRGSLDILHRQLKSDDRRFVIEIIGALGAIASPRSEEPLRDLLSSNPSYSLWIYASLSKIESESARAEIEQGLYSGERTVSRSALKAYLNYRDKRAVRTYLQLLQYLKNNPQAVNNSLKENVLKLLPSLTDRRPASVDDWLSWGREKDYLE